MLPNRSIPQCTVIPQLAYPDVRRAAAWLCDAFGFSVRIFIGDHRVQLNVGDGAMVVTEQKTPGPQRNSGASVMVRVADADDHHERARRHGAVILRPPQGDEGHRQPEQDACQHRQRRHRAQADYNCVVTR